MCRRKQLSVIVLFLCLAVVALTGCKKKTKTINPNWGIWDNPGVVLALDETDPVGDDEGYGDTADWLEMQGTYDGNFVYIHADVCSSPLIDEGGDIWYLVSIDSNGNGLSDPGDYDLAWIPGIGGCAFDYEGNSVSIPGGARVDPDGGIDYAIGRSLVNQTSFNVHAWIFYSPFLDAGDYMPDVGWAAFVF